MSRLAPHCQLCSDWEQMHRTIVRSWWCTTMMMEVCLLLMKQQLRLLVMPVPGDHQPASRPSQRLYHITWVVMASQTQS